MFSENYSKILFFIYYLIYCILFLLFYLKTNLSSVARFCRLFYQFSSNFCSLGLYSDNSSFLFFFLYLLIYYRPSCFVLVLLSLLCLFRSFFNPPRPFPPFDHHIDISHSSFVLFLFYLLSCYRFPCFVLILTPLICLFRCFFLTLLDLFSLLTTTLTFTFFILYSSSFIC